MKLPLLAGFLVASSAFAAEGGGEIPSGLRVQYRDGKIGVTAKDQSVKQILQDVAQKAGFALEGVDLLPEDRVSVLLAPSSVREEIADLLSLAPKLNYVVVYGTERARPIARVTLFPREGNTGVMNVSGGPDMGGHSSSPPPLPPPPPPPMQDMNNETPRYVPPEHPPVYIPPDEPPVYIPPDEPPKYIPADGPPEYIPPAPPGTLPPGNPPQTPPPPQDPNGTPPGQ